MTYCIRLFSEMRVKNIGLSKSIFFWGSSVSGASNDNYLLEEQDGSCVVFKYKVCPHIS